MLDSTHVDAILAALVCHISTCPNRDSWCYVIDHIHLKVLPHHMKNWSMAINNGLAALDAPPPDLIKALMPAQSGGRNPMRDPEPETSKSSKPAPDSTTPVAPPHYPYPMPPYPFYNPYGPPLHQTPTPLHQTPTRSKSNNARIDILSSPLVSEGDQAEKLMNYVDWLAIRTPSLAEQLMECKEALRKGGYTFKQLQKLSDAQFAKMGIEDGFMMQLQSMCNKYDLTL